MTARHRVVIVGGGFGEIRGGILHRVTSTH
jgi:NADH dehydrogenase FAD-containing subunit